MLGIAIWLSRPLPFAYQDRIVLEDAAYGKEYRLTIESGDRLSGKHKLTPAVESKGKMARIDGQIFWGDQWATFGKPPLDERSRLLGRITITVAQKSKIEFPAKSLFGLFFIQLKGQASPPYWIEETGIINLKLYGGDGGDAYSVVFRVSPKSKTITRSIYLSEHMGFLGERKVFKYK